MYMYICFICIDLYTFPNQNHIFQKCISRNLCFLKPYFIKTLFPQNLISYNCIFQNCISKTLFPDTLFPKPVFSETALGYMSRGLKVVVLLSKVSFVFWVRSAIKRRKSQMNKDFNFGIARA